jgi:hypothetical protein
LILADLRSLSGAIGDRVAGRLVRGAVPTLFRFGSRAGRTAAALAAAAPGSGAAMRSVSALVRDRARISAGTLLSHDLLLFQEINRPDAATFPSTNLR